MWKYDGKEFASKDIEDYVGFVYVVTFKPDGRKYIGKKNFWSKKTLPPLKGKTRKRKIVKESDWKTYCGSSEEIQRIVEKEEKGIDIFDREILHLCKSKGEMSYIENKEIYRKDALLREDYFNKFLGCKIHASHVKSLWIDS